MTLDPRRAPPAPPTPPVAQPGYSSAEEAGNRPQSATGQRDTPQQLNKRRRLKFCTVCANNQNRSMEAHLRLASADYPVLSFGTGSSVRLPGPSITKPNVYSFDTISYDAMYKELEAKDSRLYHANGVLEMLERNRNIKRRPERWQDWSIGVPRTAHGSDKGSAGVEGGVVDVVLTCEERCWEAVVEDLTNRGGRMNKPVHVINISIIDNAKEALFGGGAILDLANRLQSAAEEEERIAEEALREGRQVTEGFDERVPEIIAEWEERWPTLSALWTVAWF